MSNYYSSIVAWLVISLFYCYQYMLRALPNVLSEAIRIDFTVRAEQFATLGAYYMLAYSLVQIPLGVLVDRFGIRKILLYSIGLCLVGSTLFASSSLFWVAQMSRAMMGLGSAAAFMCAVKKVSDDLPKKHHSLILGITLAFGTITVCVFGKLILFLMNKYQWREVNHFINIFGVIIWILVFILVKQAKNSENINYNKRYWISSIRLVLEVLKNKHIMLYAILAIGLFSPLATIADLWGSSFISQKYSLDHAAATNITLLLYLGLTLGSIVVPIITERYANLDFGLLFCTYLLTILFAIIIYMPITSSALLYCLMLLLGFCCGAEMMCFAGALNHATRNNSGEIIGVVNTFNMLSGALLQQLIGTILDWRWQNTMTEHGMRYYNNHDYTIAMLPITLVMLFSCIAALLLYYEKGYHKQ